MALQRLGRDEVPHVIFEEGQASPEGQPRGRMVLPVLTRPSRVGYRLCEGHRVHLRHIQEVQPDREVKLPSRIAGGTVHVA